MNCANCKSKKVGPQTCLHGGFICPNAHMQCGECNSTAKGQCGVCEHSTNFVQMTLMPAADVEKKQMPTLSQGSAPGAPTVPGAPAIEVASGAAVAAVDPIAPVAQVAPVASVVPVVPVVPVAPVVPVLPVSSAAPVVPSAPSVASGPVVASDPSGPSDQSAPSAPSATVAGDNAEGTAAQSTPQMKSRRGPQRSQIPVLVSLRRRNVAESIAAATATLAQMQMQADAFTAASASHTTMDINHTTDTSSLPPDVQNQVASTRPVHVEAQEQVRGQSVSKGHGVRGGRVQSRMTRAAAGSASKPSTASNPSRRGVAAVKEAPSEVNCSPTLSNISCQKDKDQGKQARVKTLQKHPNSSKSAGTVAKQRTPATNQATRPNEVVEVNDQLAAAAKQQGQPSPRDQRVQMPMAASRYPTARMAPIATETIADGASMQSGGVKTQPQISQEQQPSNLSEANGQQCEFVDTAQEVASAPVVMEPSTSRIADLMKPDNELEMHTLYFGKDPQCCSTSDFNDPIEPDHLSNILSEPPSCESDLQVLSEEGTTGPTTNESCDEENISQDMFSLREENNDSINNEIQELQIFDGMIQNSEIRFMDSTESLMNFYSSGTQQAIELIRHAQAEHLKARSMQTANATRAPETVTPIDTVTVTEAPTQTNMNVHAQADATPPPPPPSHMPHIYGKYTGILSTPIPSPGRAHSPSTTARMAPNATHRPRSRLPATATATTTVISRPTTVNTPSAPPMCYDFPSDDEIIREFEHYRNTAPSGKVLDHYVRTYNQIPFPVLPMIHPLMAEPSLLSECDDNEMTTSSLTSVEQVPSEDSQQDYIGVDKDAHQRHISVSTESKPRLLDGGEPCQPDGGEPCQLDGGEPCQPDGGEPCQLDGGEPAASTPSGFNSKHLPLKEFFVMKATGVPKPQEHCELNTDKIERISIDMRMQRVLETFKENTRMRQQLVSVKSEQAKKLVKQPSSVWTPKRACKIFVAPEMTDIMGVKNNNSPVGECDITIFLSSTYRAFFEPAFDRYIKNQTENPTYLNPMPQFEVISVPQGTAENIFDFKGHYLSRPVMEAAQLNILRAPFQCPDSTCKRISFVSNFSKHLIVDHVALPIERIMPKQYKNCFIDPRLTQDGSVRCHLLYLVRNKIINLGSSEFKDFLPVLVMSARIKLSEIINLTSPVAVEDDTEYLMIYLNALQPDDFPVWCTVGVWAHSEGRRPICHKVYSGESYSVRCSQKPTEIYKSGRALMLSSMELVGLSHANKELLELQVLIH